MQTSTIIAAALAPTLGAFIWKMFQSIAKIGAVLVWKRMPYGAIRSFLLREADPFKIIETPIPPSSYGRARRPNRPLAKPKR